MSKNLTLDQFIKKAQEREKSRMKLGTYEVKALGGSIQLQSIGFDKLMDMLDGVDDSSQKEQLELNKEIVMKSVPMLANEELQNALECTVPDQIVYKVFTVDEVNDLVAHILRFNGIDITVDELKN